MSLRRVPDRVVMLLSLGLAIVLTAATIIARSAGASGRQSELFSALPGEVPLAVDKSLGINADLSHLGSVERNSALERMEACGFRWLRHRFSWDVGEPHAGFYEWAAWDELIQAVEGHGLSLVALLDGSPSWARAEEDVGNPLAPPVESRDFGEFAAAFSERYGSRIDFYQIWDEPNIAPHWGQHPVDPAAYGRLLREAAIRIRANDPQAVILTAGLAPNVEPGGSNMSELMFLERLYESGGGEWFDVVAAQPYSFGDPLEAMPQRDRLNWRRTELLRQVMEEQGDSATAVWAASFGVEDEAAWPSGQAVTVARRSWPWMGPMLWAAWSPGDVHGAYALTDSAGATDVAFELLCDQAQGPAVAWPGVYPANHHSGQYYGEWRVAPAGADIGFTGDRLVISFHGTRLDLTVRRGDYRAFLYVTIDGVPANGLPRDTEDRAYAVLYDPEHKVETLTLARGLPDGEHTAQIIAERGWGQWAIVGWAVSREARSSDPWPVVGLGLAALASWGVAIRKICPSRQRIVDAGQQLLLRYRELDERWTLALTTGVAVLAYVTVGSVPSLIAIGLLGALLALRPRMGLPLIAAALPFYQLGKPLLGKVFSMVEILCLLTALGWLVSYLLGDSHREPVITGDRSPRLGHDRRRLLDRASSLNPLDWGVLAFVIWSAASVPLAEHGREAAREFRTVVLGASLFYGLLRALLGAAPAHGQERPRWPAVWQVVDAWVLGGVLIGLVAFYQWMFGQNLITTEGVWRVRGLYGSPNNLALYLGRVLPLALTIFLWGGSSTGRRTASNPRRRWTYGIAAMVMAGAILLTYSRAAWLLGVPGALLFVSAVRGRRAFLGCIAMLALLALGMGLLGGVDRLYSLLDTTQGTSFFRMQLWRSSWAMLRDHPVLGVGLDNFLYEYRTYYVLPTAWEEFNLSHPHNLVLDIWLRIGIPGLAIIICLLVGFFRRAGRAYRSLSGHGQLLVLGLMGGMVSFVAHGLVDNAFFLVDLGFVFMMMLALVQVPVFRQQQVSLTGNSPVAMQER